MKGIKQIVQRNENPTDIFSIYAKLSSLASQIARVCAWVTGFFILFKDSFKTFDLTVIKFAPIMNYIKNKIIEIIISTVAIYF